MKLIPATVTGLATTTHLLLGTPVFAANAVRPGANGNKFGSVFVDAGPIAKLLVLIMLALIVVSIIGAARRGAWPAGARIAARMVSGGPILGLAGATFLAMNIVVRVVYSGQVPPFIVWAPGLAEMLMVITVGLLASVVGMFTRRVVVPTS